MKKFVVLILAFSLIIGLMAIPIVSANSNVLYQLIYPTGAWGSVNSVSFAPRSIVNLPYQTVSNTEAFTAQAAHISAVGIDPGITHGMRFKTNGPDAGKGGSSNTAAQYSLTAGTPINTSYDWKNAAAIEGFFSLCISPSDNMISAITSARLGISVLGSDGKTVTLTIPAADAGITISPAMKGKWQELYIPLSLLDEKGTGTFWDTTTGTPFTWTADTWSKVNGVTILVDSPDSFQCAYFADLKFVSCITPPSSPMIISAEPGNISLSWTAPSDAPDGYQVSRGVLIGGTVSDVTILNSAVTTTSYTDTTAQNNTEYVYYIRSYNGSDVSSACEITIMLGQHAATLPTANNTIVSQILTTQTGQPNGYSFNGVTGWYSHGGASDHPTSGTGNPASFPEGTSGAWRWRLNDSGTGQFGGGFSKSGGINLLGLDKSEVYLNAYIAAMGDFATAASDLKIAIAVRGSDSKTILLAVPLSDALFENNQGPSYSGKDDNWKKLSVPLSYFEANGTLLTPNHEDVTSFPWSSFNGIYFLCNTVVNSKSILRVADLKLTTYIGEPSSLNAQLNGGAVSLDWSAAENATEYKIYRAKVVGQSITDLVELSVNNSTTSYTDIFTAAPDTTYRYFVQAISANAASELVTVDLQTPPVLLEVVYKDGNGDPITDGLPSSGTIAPTVSIELTTGQAVRLYNAIYKNDQLIDIKVSILYNTVGINTLTTNPLTIPGSGYYVKSFVLDESTYCPYLDDVFFLD